MTFEEATLYISSLESRGWRLGLDRMEAFARFAGFADALGGSSEGPQFIHVAGTNGKGSTTAFLQSLMVSAGFQTGAFFSPFVVTIRERVQRNRELISEDDFARHTAELRTLAESFPAGDLGPVTEFEFKTALGFRYWQEQRCQWVALETGLGGRLDATNIVRPRSTIITSIGLDHCHILGDTHGLIAAEKAGIIKPSVPLVLGNVNDEAREVILRIAGEKEAPVWQFGKDITVNGREVATPAGAWQLPERLGIRGPIQIHNAALAVSAMLAAGLRLTPDQITEGLEQARIPARFDLRAWQGRPIVIDGAHNAQAAETLAECLKSEFPPDVRFHLITNMLTGHSATDFYEPLRSWVESASVVPIDFFRARMPEDTAQELRAILPDVRVAASMTDALQAGAGRPILVTGSNYLAGDALRTLDPSLR